MKNTANTNPTTTTTNEAKATNKSRFVDVTIHVPRRQARRLERAAKLLGVSFSRLLEIKLLQT